MGDHSYVARFGWTPRDLFLLPFSLFFVVFGVAMAVSGAPLWGALAGLLGAGYLVMWTVSWLGSTGCPRGHRGGGDSRLRTRMAG